MDFLTDFINKAVGQGMEIANTAEITPSESFKRIRATGDKPGKKNISYWLRIEHDFAYGYMYSFKRGLTYKYKSYNNDPSLSRADLNRIKSLLKVRQAEEDSRIAERHAKIAERSKIIWEKASTNGQSDYNTKKSITPFTARYINNNTLLIPIFEPSKDGLEMVSYQTIKPDGSKRFPFGGKKKGCFHIIGTIKPDSDIIICEGYATGLTLHDATKLPVVVAFDAGNLLPVSKNIRSHYKNNKFIIAADNDLSGVGQSYAEKVVAAIPNVSVIVCPTEGKDFNDIGVQATRDAFNISIEAPVQLSNPIINPANDWQDYLITDKKGFMLATSMQNITLYTMHHHTLKGVFAYDTFKQQVLVKSCPPWLSDIEFKVAPITDNDITRLTGYLETFGLSPSHDKAFKAVNLVAEENSFNSAADYISNLVWDGKPRLESFLYDIGCNQENPEYLSFVFKKWMTAAVKRIFEPGCKFDHILILESQQQGLYKSSALKELATFNGESYYTDAFQINDIGNEYSYLKLQGVTFVELSEFAGFGKKDDETIKNWITQSEDSVRLPYDRTVSKFLRKFVLCSTTNRYDYLKDPSGNRRYWPVTITKAIDIKFLSSIKEQLWAEAYYNYMNNLYIGPTPHENELAEIERSKRLETDAWEEMILKIITDLNLDEFRATDILERMGLKTFEKTDKAVTRIGKVLKGLGYQNRSVWSSTEKRSVRLWGRY